MDRVFLAAALVGALGSFGWFGWQGRARGGSRDISKSTKLTAAYVPPNLVIPAMNPGEWLPPTPQNRGAEWIYDVFTPPEIFYDGTAQKFAVLPPPDTPETGASDVGLEVVQRTAYPLQLVGYVGEAGRYLGTFENRHTGEVFLAGRGRAVPALGLVIRDFTLERMPLEMADNLTASQWIAMAVVRDERTGDETTLRAGEQSYLPNAGTFTATDDDEYDSTPR